MNKVSGRAGGTLVQPLYQLPVGRDDDALRELREEGHAGEYESAGFSRDGQ